MMQAAPDLKRQLSSEGKKTLVQAMSGEESIHNTENTAPAPPAPDLKRQLSSEGKKTLVQTMSGEESIHSTNSSFIMSVVTMDGAVHDVEGCSNEMTVEELSSG